MIQRILVATDFSSTASNAVGRAALIAKDKDAELTLLHVLPERALIDRIFHRRDVDYAAITAAAERVLHNQVEALRKDFAVSAITLCAEGPAHRAIAESARACNADLVVIGARGRSEALLTGKALGGTALKCFSSMALALLLVRRVPEGNYSSLLAALDDTCSAHDVLAWALELRSIGTTCQALHVYDAPFADRLRNHGVPEATLDAYASEYRERCHQELTALMTQLQSTDRVSPVLVRGELEPTIVKEVIKRQPDAVVVGRNREHPHNDVDGLGSIGLGIALNTAVDVLVVPTDRAVAP